LIRKAGKPAQTDELGAVAIVPSIIRTTAAAWWRRAIQTVVISDEDETD
jgi:hypothetical protein